MVHKFLNFFLKRKTEREIRQYETVEKAYQIIKASTVGSQFAGNKLNVYRDWEILEK